VYCCKGDLCNACPDRGAVSAAMVFVVVLAAVTSSWGRPGRLTRTLFNLCRTICRAATNIN